MFNVKGGVEGVISRHFKLWVMLECWLWTLENEIKVDVVKGSFFFSGLSIAFHSEQIETFTRMGESNYTDFISFFCLM